MMVIDRVVYNFAKVMSVLFHPLLLPTYTFLFISGTGIHLSTRETKVRLTLALLVFITTFLIPMMVVMVLKTLGIVRTLEMPGRSERTLPLLLSGVVYYLSYRFFLRYNLPVEYSLVLLGATAMILIAMFVNLRWKISIHMMGIGGVTGILHGMAQYIPNQVFVSLVIVIAIAGLLGFSRMVAGSHKPGEIYTGFLTGYLLFVILFLAVR